MADDPTVQELEQLDPEQLIDIGNGRKVKRDVAIKFASVLGDGWVGKVEKNDRIWGGVKTGAAVAGTVAGMLLPGGEGPAIAEGINLMRSAPSIMNAAKLFGNTASAGANIYAAAKDPGVAVPGMLGARGAEALLRLKGITNPAAVGAAIGAGGGAGVATGEVARGDLSLDPQSPDFFKNAAGYGAMIAAPAAAGTLGAQLFQRAKSVEAMRSIENAAGKDAGSLFKNGVLRAESSEAPLVAGGVPDALTNALPAASTPINTAAILKENAARRGVAMAQADADVAEAELALNYAKDTANAEGKNTARQRLVDSQLRVNKLAQEEAAAKAEYTIQREELAKGPDSKRRVEELDKLFEYNTQARKLDNVVANEKEIEKKLVPVIATSTSPEAVAVRRFRGARLSLKVQHAQEKLQEATATQLSQAAAQSKTPGGVFDTFNERQRIVGNQLGKTPSAELGRTIVNAGADGFEVASRMAPDKVASLRDSVLNEVLQRSRMGDSMRVNPETMLQQVRANKDVLSAAFPQFSSTDLMKKFEEAAPVFAKMNETPWRKTLRYLDNRAIWATVETAALGVHPIAGAAVLGTDAAIIGADRIMKMMIENDAFRKSALAWVEHGKTGRTTGDAGRAFFTWLASHPEDRAETNLLEERR